MARKSLRAGDRAPALSGTLADGSMFDLQAPRNRAMLVEFHRGTW